MTKSKKRRCSAMHKRRGLVRASCMYVCSMYVYIYSPDMDIQKYTVTMKIIVNSVKISSPIGTIIIIILFIERHIQRAVRGVTRKLSICNNS